MHKILSLLLSNKYRLNRVKIGNKESDKLAFSGKVKLMIKTNFIFSKRYKKEIKLVKNIWGEKRNKACEYIQDTAY